jgi:hypothetical protein
MPLAAQPPLTVSPVVNAPCDDGPKLSGGKPISVGTPLDSGFVSLFNGTDLTGWWENCNVHTTDKVKGGVWIVDPSSKILYSREEGQNGDILVTNESFDNYELVMDLWPTFGNDGGIFNRVTTSGKCWQTTVDYIQGSGVAGSFNEADWMPGVNLNDDPFRFNGGPANPTITTWTTFTKDLNPTGFGCSSGGCTASDFEKVWDVNGWNQIRVKFYDGLTAGREVRMKTWIRKLGAENWVPVYDQHKAVVTPAAPVALQIHGGGRWKAGSYNLYRNIKIRKLNVNGEPLTTTVVGADGRRTLAPRLSLAGGALIGALEEDASITLSDARGRVLDAFRAPAGRLERALPARARGLLFAHVKNGRGETATLRLSRIR